MEDLFLFFTATDQSSGGGGGVVQGGTSLDDERQVIAPQPISDGGDGGGGGAGVSLDATASVDLVPGGGDIPVTAENRGRYVHLMAHHLLHAQVHNPEPYTINSKP